MKNLNAERNLKKILKLIKKIGFANFVYIVLAVVMFSYFLIALSLQPQPKTIKTDKQKDEEFEGILDVWWMYKALN